MASLCDMTELATEEISILSFELFLQIWSQFRDLHLSESVNLHGIARSAYSWREFCSRLLIVFLVREAKYLRVVNLSKPHGIFSFRTLLEQSLYSDMLLKSLQILVERFSRRQIYHDQGHCSKKRRVGFDRIDLLEFRKLISSVFHGVSGPKAGTQLSFERVEVVLFRCYTCLWLSPPLESIVSKRWGSKGDTCRWIPQFRDVIEETRNSPMRRTSRGVLLGFARERLGKFRPPWRTSSYRCHFSLEFWRECGKSSLQVRPGFDHSFRGCGLKSWVPFQLLRDSLPQVELSNLRFGWLMPAAGVVCEGRPSQVLPRGRLQGFLHPAVSHGNYSQLQMKYRNSRVIYRRGRQSWCLAAETNMESGCK